MPAPDPATVRDGRLLAMWPQLSFEAGFPGVDPPAGYGWAQGLAPALPDGSYVVAPQYFFNPAGGDDAVWVQNALTQAAANTGFSQGARVRLMPVTYNFNSSVTLGLNQYVQGSGMGTTIVALGAAAANPAFTLVNSTGLYSVTQFAGLRDLTVDLRSAASAAIGVQAGDIVQLQILDVDVRGSGSGVQQGFAFVNQHFQTEQAWVRAYTHGVQNPVIFDVQGGTSSFDRGDFEFFIDQFNPSGNGIAWLDGALQRGGALKLRGNFSSGVTNTGKVLAFSGAGASLVNVQFDVSVECDGASGVGPQTVNFNLGSNTISGYGLADFLNGAASFQASNNNGQFTLAGPPVIGDNTLNTLINAGAYTIISSGFPAGWTGTVKLEKMAGQDQVFAVINLTIAATTVVTAGETILAAATLVSPFLPVAGLNGWAQVTQDVNGTHTTVPIAIQNNGAVVYQGGGFTAAGTTFLQGSAVYSNSQ